MLEVGRTRPQRKVLRLCSNKLPQKGKLITNYRNIFIFPHIASTHTGVIKNAANKGIVGWRRANRQLMSYKLETNHHWLARQEAFTSMQVLILENVKALPAKRRFYKRDRYCHQQQKRQPTTYRLALNLLTVTN